MLRGEPLSQKYCGVFIAGAKMRIFGSNATISLTAEKTCGILARLEAYTAIKTVVEEWV